MSDELILKSLDRIEKNQKDHAEATNIRLQSIEGNVTTLVAQQVSDDKLLADHEDRIRKK